MEWELVKPWVNRVGIVLEFLSFWFAAPEILGEERLRALERRVERGISLLAVAMAMIAGLAGMMGLVGLTAVTIMGEEAMADWGWVAGIALMAGIGMWLAIMYEQKALPRLLRVLADDTRIRRRSLAMGAVLFVVGFLLQLVATF